jgi:hypothetical protein
MAWPAEQLEQLVAPEVERYRPAEQLVQAVTPEAAA